MATTPSVARPLPSVRYLPTQALIQPRVAVAVLVCLSATVRFGVSVGLPNPWIAPDEMVYGLLGRSFWETGHMTILPGTYGFYGIYPAVAGLPLATLGPHAGLVALKALQAALVSATGAIVYVWARRLVGGWWPVGAAAMTLALPALGYSGLAMTESVFLPAATLALWRIARALEDPTRANQAWAVACIMGAAAVRLQGLLLVPTVAAAACLYALAGRSGRLLRPLVPALVVTSAASAALALGIVSTTARRTLGAYGDVTRTTYATGSSARWVAYHAGDVYLLVAGVPVIALLMLAVAAARGGERDPGVRSIVVVTAVYCAGLVVQVGVFASTYVHQLAERDLITVGPPLFAILAVWLGRGLPRPQPAAAVCAAVAALPALFLPVRTLVTPAAVPDAFTTVPLLRLAEYTSASTMRYAWLAAVAGSALLATAVPRRAAPVLAALVIATLAMASGLAQGAVASAAARDRADFFGGAPPSWIDRVARQQVTFLADPDPLWNDVWQQVFWNERIRSVAALPGTRRARLPAALAVSVRPDGRIVDRHGQPLAEGLVVARDRLTLVGTRLRSTGRSKHEPGLTLWRTRGHPAVSTWVTGLGADGRVFTTTTVRAFACAGGMLSVSLAAVGYPAAATLSVDALRPITLLVPANTSTRVVVPAPDAVGEHADCLFRVGQRGPLYAKRIAFARATLARTTLQLYGSRGQTRYAIVARSRTAGAPERVVRMAYCLRDAFLNLAPDQPRRDPRYGGATPAIFVAGQGLMCAAPAGYVQHGYATEDLHVPAGIYPLFVPGTTKTTTEHAK